MFQYIHQIGSCIYVQIRSAGNPPVAFRVSFRRLYTLLCVVAVCTLMLMAGTLLFFGEVELNRKLTEKVLELETKIALSNASRSIAPQRAPASIAVPSGTLDLGETSPAQAAQPVRTSPVVAARLTELSAQCFSQSCQIKSNLIPSSPGVAQGGVLMVLEAEVVRIGGADPNSPVRRQYITYPGFETIDDFNPDMMSTLGRKSFKFTRALPSRVEFSVGQLHKPVAINVYLFDHETNLIHHERKTILYDY